jgi:glucosamine--fructose-6-phosphate aminotransferase (isomerizing)
VLTTLLISEAGYAEESAMALEIKKLGGAAAVIANDVAEQLSQSADLSIDLRLDVPECIRSVAYVIWGQLIGVYLGLHKGLDPDQPHNLSRVVVLQD